MGAEFGLFFTSQPCSDSGVVASSDVPSSQQMAPEFLPFSHSEVFTEFLEQD